MSQMFIKTWRNLIWILTGDCWTLDKEERLLGTKTGL